MRRTAFAASALVGLGMLVGCSSSADSCLDGTWELVDTSQFRGDQITSMGGSFSSEMTFGDGVVSSVVESSIPATDTTVQMDTQIVATGGYSVSNGTLTVTDVTVTTTINGETSPTGSSTAGLSEGAKPYTCGDGELTIDAVGFAKK